MLDRATKIKEQMIAWRRNIHRHPELGFKEERTAALVAETLRGLGIPVRTGVGKTGVVGYLGEGKPVVALRADMDALPIQEKNQAPYASTRPGVMHACGHDAHTAILLGVATLLHDQGLPGQVRLLFQPAEETADEENKSGAQRMIEDGAMEGVDVVMALHVSVDTPTGFVQMDAGPASAATDTFFAKVIGQGCHGAYPHRGIDPVFITAQVINAINGIVSRRLDPFQPAVITIGSIRGGAAPNVIPHEVELSGTIRSMDEEVRERLFAELERAFSSAQALGGKYELTIKKGCPPVINDGRVIELLRQVAADLLGAERIQAHKPGMGGEDFSYMTALAPGAMFRLGAQIGEEVRLGHSGTFDLDENALPIGAAILAEATRRCLTGEWQLS